MRYFWIAILLFACKQEAPPTASVLPSFQTGTEDEIIDRLSIHMYPTSDSSLLAKETNQIIEHCIAHGYDMEWRDSMAIQIVDAGQGRKLAWGDPVCIHYEGKYLDGTVFDNSELRDKPLCTYVGNLIDAWNTGLTYVGAGGKMHLICPSHLAYGPTGKGKVGPNKILFFSISVVPYQE